MRTNRRNGFCLTSSFFCFNLSSMGIISPADKKYDKRYVGSKKALAEAMSYAANEYIESPVSGEKVTMWQAVVDRLYKTAIYAENDKDATSAAKVIAERLFGRAPVQKQESKHEIPAIIFAEKGDTLGEIADKASRADCDERDDAETPVGIKFDDGTEVLV